MKMRFSIRQKSLRFISVKYKLFRSCFVLALFALNRTKRNICVFVLPESKISV